MAQPEQDEPLDLSNDVGWCRGCQQRRVLCAFGQCVACHDDSAKQGRREAEDVGHLCCGWWRTGELLESWRCPTCGKVHGHRP
jgi:hypothetical protein